MGEETIKPTGFRGKLDRFFHISEKGSKIGTEIIAGVVTFLAMAYILTLNPNIIAGSNKILWASVFIATVFGAVIGTVLMALVARAPLAQAPGLGLNGMVAAMIGSGMSLGFKMNFGNAMLVVLISGVIFLLLSIIKIKGVSIREMIFKAIPSPIRKAISVGIGLFIAFIGLNNAGFITTPVGTPVGFIGFNSYPYGTAAGGALVCLIGFFAILILEHFKIKGGVIIGILFATLIGIPLGVTKWSNMDWNFTTYFANFFSFKGDAINTGATFFSVFTEGFKFDAGATVFPIIMAVISFCMVDMFDTMGTALGCAKAANMINKDGTIQHYDGIMFSDSVATVAGALLGTSTVTTFVESGAGVAAGGRTGLTALSTAGCFLLSIFLLPLFASIPSAAASAALLYVGLLMLKGSVDFEFIDIKSSAATFMTVLMMPLTYSITNGIGFGIITYVVVDVLIYAINKIIYLVSRKNNPNTTRVNPKWDLHPVLIVTFALFMCYFFVPAKLG